MSTTEVSAPASRASSTTETKSMPGLDLTIDRLMALLATLMVPGGIVAIGLAWYGAAHTPFLFEQVPYLISGGLLGVGLLSCGGMLYVGSWIARLADVQRTEGDKTREALLALRNDLRELPQLMPSPNGEAPGVKPTFVATKTGTMYHVEGCTVVAGRADLRDVDGAGLRPCKLCRPDLVAAGVG